MLPGFVHTAVCFAEVVVNVHDRLEKELRRIDCLNVVFPGDVMCYAVLTTPEVAISSVRLVHERRITHSREEEARPKRHDEHSRLG